MIKNQSRWSSQRQAHMNPFIRKGEVGDCKSYFSASQTLQLIQKFRGKTTGTESANLCNDLFLSEADLSEQTGM